MSRDTRYDYPISVLIEETQKNNNLLLPQQIWIQLGIAYIDGKCWGRPDLEVINDYFQAHRVDVRQSEVGAVEMAVYQLKETRQAITHESVRREVLDAHKYALSEKRTVAILKELDTGS
jgi:hypothetical protein